VSEGFAKGGVLFEIDSGYGGMLSAYSVYPNES
jgi:hypothetical protein